MKYDAVVVGGSTSGFYAAELLASRGLSVGVFERRANLDAARRTLIVTPGLERLVGKLPADAILHRLSIMAVQAGDEECEVELKDPDVIVERSYLMRHWAQRATNAGAEIHFGMSFDSLEEHTSGVAVKFRGEGSDTVTAHTLNLIAADGVVSKVAEASGLQAPPRVPLLQVEIDLPPKWDPAVTKVWFDGTTRYFYWLIPESDTRGVVGLASAPDEPIKPALDNFLQQLGIEGGENPQSAQVALYRPGLKVHAKTGKASVFLVGDAAGDVKVSTVGGSVTGFRGAEAVAQHLITGKSLRRLRMGLDAELFLHWYARFLLERIGTRGYEKLVRNMNPATLKLLAENDRDRLAKWAWKVPFAQPRLLTMPIHGFRRRSKTGL